jgi:type IV secretory pathway TraG/TraD family ATPase VirD4
MRFYLIIQDFDQLKEKYKDQAGTIKSNCNNWLYLLTADNNTAQEISKRLGKYTIETSRSSISNRLKSNDFNISNDKSLTGRELLTSDELMKFYFGEGLMLRTRFNPIRSNLPIINNYEINRLIKNVEYPNESKHNIQLFDLNFFRKANKLISDLGDIKKIDSRKTKIIKRKE